MGAALLGQHKAADRRSLKSSVGGLTPEGREWNDAILAFSVTCRSAQTPANAGIHRRARRSRRPGAAYWTGPAAG